jgi:hypothetical protein
MTLSNVATALADFGWLVCLWLALPLAILALGAPVVLVVGLSPGSPNAFSSP